MDGTSLPENTQGLSDLVGPIAGLAQMKNPACPAVKREAEEEWPLPVRPGGGFRLLSWLAAVAQPSRHAGRAGDQGVSDATAFRCMTTGDG